MLQKLPQKLLAYWNSLPAWLKTCIVLVAASSSGVIRHMYVADHGCLTEHCILEYFYAGLHVGGVAVFFYFLHSPFGQQVEAELQAGQAVSSQGLAQTETKERPS
jgi:hypothetical protein